MSYTVKEIYYTIHGEGHHAGRPSVFCRFAGCNLWSGLERDRARAACDFCDTDFVGTDGPGGGAFAAPDELAQAVSNRWQPEEADDVAPRVVCTGGEPLLQLDAALVEAFHRAGLEVAVETNGTLSAPEGIDWLCVSPKSPERFVLRAGHELKLVYPRAGLEPQRFASLPFEHYFLQPIHGPDYEENLARVTQFCLDHPQWRVSIQMHKLLGLP